MKTLIVAIFKTIINITAQNCQLHPDSFVPHVCLPQLVFSHPFIFHV